MHTGFSQFRKYVLFFVVLMYVISSSSVFGQQYPNTNDSEPQVVFSGSATDRVTGQVTSIQTDTKRIIDFESYSDKEWVSDQYQSMGLTIQGAVILQQGGSLNTPHYLPKSGINVIYDGFDNDLGIQLTFDSAHPVFNVGFFFTARYDLNVKIYTTENQLLSDRNLVGGNYAPSGIPNHKFEYQSNLIPIERVEVHTINANEYYQGWNSFTLDDLYFDSDVVCNLAVTKLYQTDPRWANEPYGAKSWQGSDGYAPTIKNWGCALVSVTMLINQQSEKFGSRSITPLELNQWLRSADGGYTGGYINFYEVANFAKVVLGLDLNFVGRNYNIDDKKIQAELCALNSVVMEVYGKRGHFVLARGFDSSGYLMNDPLGPTDHLLEKYPDGPASLRQFVVSKEFNGIELVASSEISIRISDPNGNAVQLTEPTTEKSQLVDGFRTEILGAVGYYEYLVPFEGSEFDALIGTRMVIPVLESGRYTIQIASSSTKEVEFTLNVATKSKNTAKKVSLVLNSEHVYVMSVDYVKPTNNPGDFGSTDISEVSDGWRLFLPMMQVQ